MDSPTMEQEIHSKVAVIEAQLFGENGLIKELKEVKGKIDRFAFLFVAGCVTVAASLTASILTHTL